MSGAGGCSTEMLARRCGPRMRVNPVNVIAVEQSVAVWSVTR